MNQTVSHQRPWTMRACFASSLDGIIHGKGCEGQWQKLGSPADIHHLKTQRDAHDLIVMGASTFRYYPQIHQGHQTIPPLVILTRGNAPLHDIPPDSPAFNLANAPKTTLLSAILPPRDIRALYPKNVQWSEIPKTPSQQTNWPLLARHSVFKGHQHILFEGGGNLFEQLLKAQWIDELTLTITPHLLGGTSAGAAPLIGGSGFTLNKAPELILQAESTQILSSSSEIITLYRLNYPSAIAPNTP